jgi:hypothetical protein
MVIIGNLLVFIAAGSWDQHLEGGSRAGSRVNIFFKADPDQDLDPDPKHC